MARVDKVAVTVDHQILDAVEKLRQKTGESRSAVVTRALRLLVSEAEQRAQLERYVRGYREHPETDEEIDSAAALAAASLKGVPWS